jgi:hypothetical protein
VFGNVNGDNIVDDADLLQVLFNFGSDDAGNRHERRRDCGRRRPVDGAVQLRRVVLVSACA